MSNKDKQNENDTVEVISISGPEPRKATEVLVGIETQLTELVKLLKVVSMNSNLTIARVNALGTKVDEVHSYTETLKKEYGVSTSESNDENKVVASPEIIPVSNNPVVNNRRKLPEETEYFTDHSSNITVNPELVVEKNNVVSGRKVPVMQRVTSGETGKDIFMASVSIIDDNNKIISTSKTNASGKWQALLPAGTYKVSISKTDTKTKQEIKAEQKITVIDNGTTITLPAVMIGGKLGQQNFQQKAK